MTEPNEVIQQYLAERKEYGPRSGDPTWGKPACEVCGTWTATHEDYGLQICDKASCQEDAASTQERNGAMTKFNVGDKVQLKYKINNQPWVAEVVAVKTAYILKHEGSVTESSAAWFDEELEPAKVKLTVEEAWAEVGAMIVVSLQSDLFLEPARLRHRAYAILGGSDIEVGRQGTELHERVKSRLNGLIDRFVKKYLTESRPFGGG